MNKSDKITHHKIDLTLTRGEWSMMGFCEHDGTIYPDPQAPHVHSHTIDEFLLIAAASDSPASTYVSLVIARQQADCDNRAIHALAQSIAEHGSAIERREVSDVLHGILMRLTQRTQWTVKKQLGYMQ